jgi:tryptophan synthase alpha chain
MAEPANANDAMGKTAMARLAMVSVSIVERMGTRSFVAAAADAGFDGLIVPDADLLASDLLSEACAEADIACAFLVAPTSTPERVAAIVHRCRGFVYLLARAGVTGDAVGVGASERRTSDRQEARAPRSGGAANGRPTNAPALARQVAAIRAVNPTLPIAAGFGIATPEHVAATVAHVDAAIVGTALVRRIRDAVASGADPVAEAEGFVAALVAAAQAAASAANP